mgnify:CR=1 FL=1
MAQTEEAMTLEEVMRLAKLLSPLDKVRLIERIAPDIERELSTRPKPPGRSLLGLLKDLGPAPGVDEIEAARQEAWASLALLCRPATATRE